jgi:hypothetical protein
VAAGGLGRGQAGLGVERKPAARGERRRVRSTYPRTNGCARAPRPAPPEPRVAPVDPGSNGHQGARQTAPGARRGRSFRIADSPPKTFCSPSAGRSVRLCNRGRRQSSRRRPAPEGAAVGKKKGRAPALRGRFLLLKRRARLAPAPTRGRGVERSPGSGSSPAASGRFAPLFLLFPPGREKRAQNAPVSDKPPGLKPTLSDLRAAAAAEGGALCSPSLPHLMV